MNHATILANFTPVLAQSTDDGPGLAFLLSILALGIALLLILILVCRMQAFVALIISSIVVFVAAGQPITAVGDTLISGMGGALGFIALIIGLGAIFGQILEHSGGAQSLAKSLIGLFGEKRASWAMMLTGFVISIPVFFDVGLVILAPIIYALAKNTKKSVLVFGFPLVVGMAVTHAFVPPTPGPVWVAYTLNVSLGWVILMGVMVGLPTAILVGLFFSKKFSKLHIDPPKWAVDDMPEEGEGLKLPHIVTVGLVIGIPIALILAATVIEQVVAGTLPAGLERSERNDALSAAIADSNFFYQAITFLGHPVIALLLATLGSLIFLGVMRGATKDQLLELSTRALGPAGIIILITGAGGVFKKVLGETGIDVALRDALAGFNISPLILAYLFAMLLRLAQGSATVAMVAAAGLMTALVGDLSQAELALVVICVAAGATTASHVNDSGFWIVSRYLNMTEKQTLQTWTILTTAISVVGFVLAMVISLFV